MEKDKALYAVFSRGEDGPSLQQETHWLTHDEIQKYRGEPYCNGRYSCILILYEVLPMKKPKAEEREHGQ